ncbi:MAG: hypothetical protein JW955_15610 [Sedimentisphaerales bacterium]|nr:hypothetical protein [Sedimentisphaerales bacterium]
MDKTLKRDVIEASHRLRIVQRDFADQGESQQKQYLCEELEQLLKGIPFGERKAFLEGLLERFPARLPQVCDRAEATVPPAPSRWLATDQPMQLVDALTEVLPSLPDGERQAILDRLQGIVGAPAQTPQVPTKSLAGMRATLQLASDAEIHWERFGDLANLLAEFVLKTELLAATIWGKIAAKSSLRPPKQTRKLAGRFLNEETGNPEELTKELQVLLQFVTAIMTAASQAGEVVAFRYAKQFSPDHIHDLVDNEETLRNRFVSTDVRCWRKYCELAGDLDAEHIEKEIESAMARQAEAFVKGLDRGS